MKLLVIVPGIGKPNFPIKEEFLDYNLEIIKKTFSGQVDTMIFNYSDDEFYFDFDNVVKKPGIIGEFLLNDITPNFIDDYDWIIILIEDIELSENFNIDKMIKIYQQYNLNILSPSLTFDSKINWSFMSENTQFENKIRIVNFCEWFFYLMDKNSYTRYWNLLDKDTKWLWGLDLCLYNLGFKMALLNDYKVKHHFQTQKEPEKKWQEAKIFLSRHQKITNQENISIDDVSDLI